MKDINKSFMSEKLNEKNFKHLKHCEHSTFYLVSFEDGNLKLVKVKKLHSEVTVFFGMFYQELQIIFL